MIYNQLVARFLHPFVLYAVLGTLIGYALVHLFIKLFRIRSPKTKIFLLFLPVMIPFINLAVRQIYPGKCLLTANNADKPIGAITRVICNGGEFLSYILLPISVLTAIMAVVKGVGSIIACRQLTRKHGYAESTEYPELFRILKELSGKAGIEIPALVITRQKIARSFTFGLKKPVIVVSQGIIDNLDSEELETVIAHEVAHILRGDSLLNWVTVFFRDLMFFAPAMYFLFRDILCEKEKASDDIAMKLTDKHYAFGEALIKVWRLSPKSFWGDLTFDNFSAQPNFIKQDGTLEARLERIIDDGSRKDSVGPSKIIILVGLIVAAVLAILYILC